MSLIEEQRKGRLSPTSVYLDFALTVNSKRAALFLFFEGIYDHFYYLQRVKHFFEGETVRFVCQGKTNVIAIYDLIIKHKEYNAIKRAFFIDRDFNTPLPPGRQIFETPCYSIENFYVSPFVFNEIVQYTFLDNAKQTPEQQKILSDNLLQLYIDRQQEFHECTRLFNAWYACLVVSRETSMIKIPVNLEDKLPAGFVRYSLNAVTKHYTIQDLYAKYRAVQNEVPETDIFQKEIDFVNEDLHLKFRGKYELEFLLVMIEMLIDDSKKAKTIVTSVINFPFSNKLSLEQALNVLSSYAETPVELTDYIKRVCE